VPQGRGGRGGAFGQEGRPLTPIACTDFTTTNIAWTLPLPAYSGSTPIIWGDRIFLNVATATNTGELELWAVDRRSRSVMWKRPIAGGNNMQRKQNMSSPSPVTDGRYVWVMTGVGVLKAFDFDGKEIWHREIQTDYGRFGLNWGYASSPLLKNGALYVQVLHGMKTDDPSYVLKIDAMSGKTLWRVERLTDAQNESPDSYTTPTWIEANGRAELIVTGGDVVSGHDPNTGREYWRADVLNPRRDRAYRIVASPTIVGDLIIAPTRNSPLVAMRPGGNGNVANSHVVWSFTQGPDVPTPVSDGKLLYIVRDNGVAFALDVRTGATVYGPERLPSGTYSASPILADGKIYVTTEEEGLTTVFRAGPRFEVLSTNSLLGDCSPYCLSTVAISEGQIFMRTSSYLWAIGERRPS
jgi:outer membrane protein assembly factor BamB